MAKTAAHTSRSKSSPAKRGKDRDTIIGRSHLNGWAGWPPPKHIAKHLEFFADFINEHIVDGTILDLGCGDGSIDRLLAELSPGKKITGVDLEAHDQWRIKTPSNLKFQANSIYKLPFKAKSFDVVMMKDVLHHMPEPEKILAEVARLAKKQVLVIEANRYNPISYIRMVKIAKHEHFSRRNLKKIVGKPADIYTYETHVWPDSVKIPGMIIDEVFRLPALETLRNYNLVLFEP